MPLSGVTLTGHFISGEGHSFPPPARKDPIMLSRIIPSLLPAVWLATSAFADDKDFLLAREAWQQEDTVALAEASARLQGDPLVIYADYYLLGKQLDQTPPEAVRAFLVRYPDTWLAERLRGEYLRILGKRGDWAGVRDFLPGLQNPDQELKCLDLRARAEAEGQGSDALAEARKLWWFTGSSLPSACAELLQLVETRGLVSTDDVWDRLRLALQAGNSSLARRLAGKLGFDLPAAQLARLAAKPGEIGRAHV